MIRGGDTGRVGHISQVADGGFGTGTTPVSKTSLDTIVTQTGRPRMLHNEAWIHTVSEYKHKSRAKQQIPHHF